MYVNYQYLVEVARNRASGGWYRSAAAIFREAIRVAHAAGDEDSVTKISHELTFVEPKIRSSYGRQKTRRQKANAI